MGLRLGIGLGLVCLVAAISGARPEPVPDDPHAHMADEGRCDGCHGAGPDREGRIPDPHVFTRPVGEICRVCHPDDQIGRSHPVGVDPYRALGLKELPEELPLQMVEGERDELMTCGTCHNPHLPRFSHTRLYRRQRPAAGGGGGFLTYYLRMKGSTPGEGFTPLCHGCHPKM